MKVLLTVFCVLIALFTGGCGLILGGMGSGAGGAGLILLGACALNIIIIITLWSATGPWRPAFWFLGAVDLLLAVGLLFTFGKNAGGAFPILFFLCAAFALKGALTLYYASNR